VRLDRALLHERGELRQRARVGTGQDSVAEVEDVPGPAAGACQHIERSLLDALPRPQQDGGIEIALDAALVPDRLPAGVERDAPVEGR